MQLTPLLLHSNLSLSADNRFLLFPISRLRLAELLAGLLGFGKEGY